jgi:hypothetical protein
MTQRLVAHMKLKMIHKLIQKFDPCVKSTCAIQAVCTSHSKEPNLTFCHTNQWSSPPVFRVYQWFITQSALNLHLGISLLTNHTHVQHVRIFHCRRVFYVPCYGTVWWKVLCVFGLWEGIHWADQFEEKVETAHWWEIFHCHCGEIFTAKRDLKRHTKRLHDVK